jgi:hypothetical protein
MLSLIQFYNRWRWKTKEREKLKRRTLRRRNARWNQKRVRKNELLLYMVVQIIFTINYKAVMFAGSREDDLLNKLKNCVGSLPAHGSSLGNYCSTATKIQSFEVENSATKREASELGRFKQAGYNKAENSTKMSKIAA